jgi:hypothetical protein
MFLKCLGLLAVVSVPTTYEMIINLKTAKAAWPYRALNIARARRGDRISLINVHFWGKSGHGATLMRCPLMTQSGHPAQQRPS